jgi:hypothetical protein
MKNLIYTFGFLLLLLFNNNLKGQGLSLHVNSFPNILVGQHLKLVVPFAELRTTYEYKILGKKTSSGLSFRSINWGNEVGLSHGFTSRAKWINSIKLSNTMNLHVSLPLYYNKKRLSYAGSSVLNVSFDKFDRIALVLGTRLNYYPGYSEIGEKNYFLELIFGAKYKMSKLTRK